MMVYKNEGKKRKINEIIKNSKNANIKIEPHLDSGNEGLKKSKYSKIIDQNLSNIRERINDEVKLEKSGENDEVISEDELENSDESDEIISEDESEKSNEDDEISSDEKSEENNQDSCDVQVKALKKESVFTKISEKSQSKKEANASIFSNANILISESLKDEIIKRIESRNKATLVAVAIGKKCNNVIIKEMFPKRVSVIIPYDKIQHCNKGVAYVDFKNNSDLNDALNNKHRCKVFKMEDKKIDINDYNCNKLAISNLNYKSTVDELKSLFKKACNVTFLKSKFNNKKMAKVAFVEYNNVEDAILDYDKYHGYVLHDYPINIKFQQKTNTNITKQNSVIDEKQLMVVGLKKIVAYDQLKKLFPQAIDIRVEYKNGAAFIQYNNKDECLVDKTNAIKNKPYSTFKIFFGKTNAIKSKGIIPNVSKKNEKNKNLDRSKFNKKNEKNKNSDRAKLNKKSMKPTKFSKKN